MPLLADDDRALAPLFRARKIRTTNVHIPVELVLDIVKLAAESDSCLARTLALVCRDVHSEVGRYRYRVLCWRRPQHAHSVLAISGQYGRRLLTDNLFALYWNWPPRYLSLVERVELYRCLRWFRGGHAEFTISVLALNIEILDEFGSFNKPNALSELMIIYDPCWFGRSITMRIPFGDLTRLLLHNFPIGSWPSAIFSCKTLTHIALDAMHAQDEVSAQNAADAIMTFRMDALEHFPVLRRFLFVLRDDGDLPQFKNAELYADAIWEPDDERCRIDFDTIPCDWEKRWWRWRTQNCGASQGMDFWDSGSIVPLYLRHAKPPLAHFLNSPT